MFMVIVLDEEYLVLFTAPINVPGIMIDIFFSYIINVHVLIAYFS